MHEIRFYLDIKGIDFNPGQLKEQLGFQNVSIRTVGEKSFGALKAWDKNYWSLMTEQSELVDFSAQTAVFLRLIADHAEFLKNFVRERQLLMRITAEVIHDSESNPAIFLTAEVIRELSRWECEFEVDLMG